MKPQFLPHSSIPAHDYTGAHVVLQHEGHTLLGRIVYVCPDEAMCIVKHFNGEEWPLRPALSRLDILERTYEEEEEE